MTRGVHGVCRAWRWRRAAECRSSRLLGGLPAAAGLWLWAAPAHGIDTLVVGGTGSAFARNSWRQVRLESRRMNVTADSVWKWDVAPRTNLVPGLFQRGGRIAVLGGGGASNTTDSAGFSNQRHRISGTIYVGAGTREPFPAVALLADGDDGTAFGPDGVEVERACAIHIDLGEVYGVDRVRLYPRLDSQHRGRFPQVLVVSSSDGEGDLPLLVTANDAESGFDPFEGLRFLPPGERNYAPIVDERFRSRPVRYVRVDVREERAWELAEVEVFSDGTIAPGQFVSRPIASNALHPIWGHVRYNEGRSVAELPVVVQTATGPTADATLYYRLTGVYGQMERVSAGQWAQLSPEERGPVTRNPEWSPFETLRDGVVASPSARPYLQFRLSVTEPGVALRRLVFDYIREPLVLELLGEINPAVARVARDTTFVLALQAHTRNETFGDVQVRGFRRLHVGTSARVERVTEVTVRDRPALFSARLDPGRGFDVYLGQRITLDGTYVEITFRGAVYHDGTRFEVQAQDVVLADGKLDTVYQVATPADIEPRTPGGVLAVRLAEETRRVPLLLPPQARPPLLTPNGDGRNETAAIVYELVRLTEAAPVRLAVHDLSGRLVRVVFEGQEAAGRHEHPWDGRDGAGRVVAPGLYLARVEVRGDDRAAAGVVAVGVAW